MKKPIGINIFIGLQILFTILGTIINIGGTRNMLYENPSLDSGLIWKHTTIITVMYVCLSIYPVFVLIKQKDKSTIKKVIVWLLLLPVSYLGYSAITGSYFAGFQLAIKSLVWALPWIGYFLFSKKIKAYYNSPDLK